MKPTNFKITIEDGIPIPDGSNSLIGPIRIAIKDMKVGQSFLVQTDGQRSIALRAGKRIGITLVSRKENGAGIRIWKSGDGPSKRRCGQPKHHTHGEIERGRK